MPVRAVPARPRVFDPLLTDLFKKVQRELKSHEGLIDLNNKRYEEKVIVFPADHENPAIG